MVLLWRRAWCFSVGGQRYWAQLLSYLARQVKAASIVDLVSLYNDAFLPIYDTRENIQIWLQGLAALDDLPDVERAARAAAMTADAFEIPGRTLGRARGRSGSAERHAAAWGSAPANRLGSA